MSEKQEQIALFKRAQHHEICKKYMFHIPNGGFRNFLEGRALKMQGVKPGVPDIFLAYPKNDKHGLFIELKNNKKSRTSLSQQEWIAKLNTAGFLAKICYGWEDAWSCIEEYLK